VLSAASSPCPDLNLIHYIEAWSDGHSVCNHVNKGRLKNGLEKSAVYGSETLAPVFRRPCGKT
ncbi:hypothetical protein, partial [Neisseria sicca]|uniref:hypothetical protein n=1 Tax=Neisseria sicca TaxID=490 RepID=UPI003FA109A7